MNPHILRLTKIQNKAIRIITFANFQDEPTSLYNKSNILKFSDHVKLENIIYVHNSLRDNLPMPLRGSFQPAPDSSNTRGVSIHKLLLPKVRTLYGLHSIIYQSTAAWNYILSVLSPSKVHSASKTTCKKNITEHFIKSYALRFGKWEMLILSKKSKKSKKKSKTKQETTYSSGVWSISVLSCS